MAVIRQTIYRCDPCGREVPGRKQLRTIYLSWGQKTGGYGSDRPGVRADFCSDCLSRFAEVVVDYWGENGKKAIVAICAPKKK